MIYSIPSHRGGIYDPAGIYDQSGITNPGEPSMTLGQFRALAIGAWVPGVASTMLDGGGSPCSWNEEVAVLQNIGGGGASDAIQTTANNQPLAYPVTDPVFHLPGVAGNTISMPISSGSYDYTVTYDDNTTDTGTISSDGTVVFGPTDSVWTIKPIKSIVLTGPESATINATDVPHLATTGTATVGGTITVHQDGSNPALALHHSCARSNGQSLLTSTFDSAQTEGRFIGVVATLGDGGATDGFRIVSCTKTGGTDVDVNGWIPLFRKLTKGSFHNGVLVTSHTNPTSGKILWEAKATTGSYHTKINGGDIQSPVVDISGMEIEFINFFAQGDLISGSTILLHEALWFPATVTDEQIAEGVALLAAEYDFTI